MVYVALLRGINVGGNTTISMAVLKTCFEELGHESVKTYINSGNVIFTSQITDQRQLETTIEAIVSKKFGHALKVVVRNLNEIQQVINTIPKSWLTSTDKKCNVIFLRHEIDNPEIVERFLPKAGIEELIYCPGTLLWAAKTSDITKSSMIKLARHDIYKQMTVRNLNTARKLYELMSTA